MPDYFRDWREINSRGDGSNFSRGFRDKGIRKLEKKMLGRGIDVKNISQADLVKAMYEPPTTPEEAKKVRDEFCKMMYRFCSVRLLRGDYSDWAGWQYRSWFAVELAKHPKR